MYESFIRGEEEDEEEEDDDEEDELRVAVPDEAWAAARPSRKRELQVTIMAIVIIIMVIILEERNPFSFYPSGSLCSPPSTLVVLAVIEGLCDQQDHDEAVLSIKLSRHARERS